MEEMWGNGLRYFGYFKAVSGGARAIVGVLSRAQQISRLFANFYYKGQHWVFAPFFLSFLPSSD